MGGWIHENMQAIMIGIGLASVAGVIIIFAIYFIMQKKVRNKKMMK